MSCYVLVFFGHAVLDQATALICISVATDYRVNKLLVIVAFFLCYKQHVLFDFFEPCKLFDDVPFLEDHDL